MSEATLTLSPEYKKALIELLFQLADDDFLFAYRGSEWLGLAPHIEEDVASSSISQDSMGHVAIFYKLLEELGAGKADGFSTWASCQWKKELYISRKSEWTRKLYGRSPL